MGLAYISLVNVPEEVLLLVLTLLALGKREFLSLKNKSNVLKMLGAIAITTLFSVLVQMFMEQLSFMPLVRVVFFAVVYWLIYKMRFYEALLGFIIALILFIMMEIMGTSIMQLITGLSYYTVLDQQYTQTTAFIIFLIPRRILEIIVVGALYKININFIQKPRFRKSSKG